MVITKRGFLYGRKRELNILRLMINKMLVWKHLEQGLSASIYKIKSKIVKMTIIWPFDGCLKDLSICALILF